MTVWVLKVGITGFLLGLTSLIFAAEHDSKKDPVVLQTKELMALSLEDLMKIKVITPSKSEEKISEAPGVISVVTRDEMERFGARTLRDVLMRMPSVNLTANYLTDRSSIAIRGVQYSSPSHTLLLINGRPVREALEAGIKAETFESFPVSSIEKIELIRGPGSVVYGSTAFSGVINVITKKPSENKTQLTVHGGLPGKTKNSATMAYQFGDLGMVVGGQYNYSENWDLRFQATEDEFRDFSIPDNGYGSYLELGYKNLTYMGSYNYWQNHYALQLFIPPPPTGPVAGRQAYGEANWEKWFNDLGYRQEVTKIWDIELNVTYTQSWLAIDSFPAPNRNSFDLTAEWTNYIRPMKNLNFLVGVLGNRVQGKERSGLPLTTTIDTVQNMYSGFAQGDYHITAELKVIAGIQANKAEGIDLDVNPRLGMVWNPAENVNVKGLYSNAFRAPSMLELYLNHPTIQGNPDLVPEKVKTIDLGVNIQTDRISFGINNFYSRLSNIIRQVQNPTIPHGFENNKTATTFFGGELEFKYFITKELMLLGSGLYQKNATEGLAGNTMRVPETTAKIGLSYASKGLITSVFNIFEGKLDKRYNTPSYNKTREPFNLLNANAKYELNQLFGFKGPTITLDLEFYNLLDEEIWLPVEVQPITYTQPETQGASYYGGITIRL